MGRWKGSPQGPYWDANDTGPNQVDPPPGMSPGGPQPQQQPGGYLPPMDFPITPRGPDANPGGISGQVPGQMRPWDVDMSGDPPPGYHWEWSGGVTGGKHPVPDGQHDPQIPGQGGPTTGSPIDTSDWARKQYPGGVGGPIPPWLTGGEGGVPGQGPYGGEWTPTNQRPTFPDLAAPPKGDFAPGGAAWTGGNMQPGELWNNGQATDQGGWGQSPPMTPQQQKWANNPAYGYTPPSGKQQYWEGVPVGGGGMPSGGSLASLAGMDLGSGKKASWLEQGIASGNLNSGQWGTLSGLAGFKK